MQQLEYDNDLDAMVTVEDQEGFCQSGVTLNALLTKLQTLIYEENHALNVASQGDFKRLVDGINENLNKLLLQQQELLYYERVKAISQMSASIAHEINNPVSGILANLLYLKAIIDANLVEQLEVLDESVVELKRVAGIVQKLPSFFPP